MKNSYVQLSLFDQLRSQETQSQEDDFVDSAPAFLTGFRERLAQETQQPVGSEELIALLSKGNEVAFVKAAESTMKLYWSGAAKNKKTPRLAFFELFLQLGSQQNVSQARYLMHYGVNKKALGDFYDAGDDAIALLPSLPVSEVYVQNLPTIPELPQSQFKLNSEALQARFDELFARRRTTAEVIYLRMLLDAEDATAMYAALEEIAIGVDEFAGAKPDKALSLQRAMATFNREHPLAQAYIEGALARWDDVR